MAQESKKTRQFKQYDNLRKHLADHKIPKPGTVATILLKTFILNSGVLKADFAESKKVCKKNGFKKWVKSLDKWIVRDRSNDNWSQYKCIGDLLEYVNKEKISRGEIVTKNELEQLSEKFVSKQTFDAIQKKVERLEKSIDRVVDIVDPPSDENKRTKFQNGDYDHKLRLINGGFELEKQA